MLFIEKLNNARYLAAERLNVEDKLYFIRSRLEGQILGDIHLVKGMLSVIAANPDLQQATFTQAAKPIFVKQADRSPYSIRVFPCNFSSCYTSHRSVR